MRPRPLLAATCLAAALVAEGCGDDDPPQAARALEPVVLEVRAPSDAAVVRSEVVDVTGSVEPADAAVRVLGQVARVSSGGSFSAAVPLEPGANVIDVIATARGREASMTAVRVTRDMPVVVPDLSGLPVEDAQEQLDPLGLEFEVERDGGLLEELLPGEPAVCDQDPEAGAEVRRGTTVRVAISKRC
jgi:Glucodextranase, domain B/PASTA domain